MNKAFYVIERRTSMYNNYIKWFLNVYKEDKNLLSSIGYRTEREAWQALERMKELGREGFPIGDKVSYTTYFAMEGENK